MTQNCESCREPTPAKVTIIHGDEEDDARAELHLCVDCAKKGVQEGPYREWLDGL